MTLLPAAVRSLVPAWPWYLWAAGAAAFGAVVLAVRGATAATAGGAEDVPRPDGAPPLVSLGSEGPWVSYLQALLGVPVTGVFDAETDAAVRVWQEGMGLTADGKVGPMTWGKLGVEGAAAPPSGGGGGGAPAPKPPKPPAPQTPPGPSNPPTVGNPFGLSEGIAQREGQMLAHIQAQRFEHDWAPLDYVTADGHQVHVLISRRALALKDGANRLAISTTYKTSQQIADMIGGALMTTRIADEAAKKAHGGGGFVVMNSAGVPPSQPWSQDGTMGKTTRMYEQSNFLDKKIGGAAQGFVWNEGKLWVITRRFWPPPQGVGSGGKPYSHSANFGWYYFPAMGNSKSPGGMSVVQSIGMVHDMNHADYSQLNYFVKPNSLTIDGTWWDWAAALADPTVSKYIQDEGGTLVSPRHPDL